MSYNNQYQQQNYGQPQQEGGALSWGSLIEKESSFIIVEPGVYDFKVVGMTKGTYQPSQKSSIRDVSPQAELEVEITTPSGDTTTLKERLILHSKMEWKISEFFIAIGQKQPGVPLNPDWNMVIGAVGKAEIEINKYQDRDGNDRENNRVKNFLAPDKATQNSQVQAFANMNQQQQPTTPQSNPYAYPPNTPEHNNSTVYNPPAQGQGQVPTQGQAQPAPGQQPPAGGQSEFAFD